MTRVFQLMDSSEGYLAHLYRFIRPRDCLQPPNLRGTRCFRLAKGKFFWENVSIVGWLGIILVKGFSFVVPIIAANSLPWVGQATTHMFVYYLLTINSTESLEYFESLN